MNLMDLIDRARELIGGGGVDNLAENAGQLSDIAQGDGSVLEKAQQALEGIGEGGAGEAGDAVGSEAGEAVSGEAGDAAGGEGGDAPGGPSGSSG